MLGEEHRQGRPCLWKLGCSERVFQDEQGWVRVSRHQERRLRPLSAPHPLAASQTQLRLSSKGFSGVFKPVSPFQGSRSPLLYLLIPSPYVAYVETVFPLNLINFETNKGCTHGTQGGVWLRDSRKPNYNCRTGERRADETRGETG